MESGHLEHYARRFARLRTDKNRSVFPERTHNRAPYKPILLMCVMDLLGSGVIGSNFVEVDDDLTETFARYRERVLPGYGYGNLALPFFHMKSEGYWHLVPRRQDGRIGHQISSLARLREEVSGARLDDELYGLLLEEKNREWLRNVLLETYFTREARRGLLEQATVNRGAFVYSEGLLDNPQDKGVRETLDLEEAYRPRVRDQGFRRAVVRAYRHRCAMCGIRVRTPDGHTVVVAAHIVPWSRSRDDRPANGMALCQTCHWTFDEGLARVSTRYEIHVSGRLTSMDNLPGYLTSLDGRGIVRPPERAYWPDADSLTWHRQHVFRG